MKMNRKRYLVTMAVAAAVLLLSAPSCAEQGNHDPIITRLEAETDSVIPLGSVRVTCTASDPDGDVLGYMWSASAGQMSGTGPTVTWTAPSSQGSYNITVTVIDGRDGQVTGQLTITVRANAAPIITSLVADSQWVLPSGTLHVTCNASDPDGDKLSYEWSATGGDISGKGEVATWTAPQTIGTYNLTVVVADGYGGSDTRTLPISVATGQGPTIESLLVTANHCYLKTRSGGYKVGMAQQYHVECIVSGATGTVSYVWSCTGGSISGAGSAITWTAPNESVYVTMTVTVTDAIGKPASKSVLLEVVECSPCTFGC